MSPRAKKPWLFGSGKLGRPFLRMQAANLASAYALLACWAGLREGGPPPGRSLRQAASADWNCGELGSTFPLIVTPPIWMIPFPPPPEPTEAANPCEVRQTAKAVVLGAADFAPSVEAEPPGEVVVPRLATAGDFEPQPAAIATRSTRLVPNTTEVA